MSGKYCKVKTADDYPVSVAQIRQLARNIDWVRSCRLNSIGVYGRLATDAFTITTGDLLFFPGQTADLSYYNKLHIGIIADGAGAARWSITVSMFGGGTTEATITSENPGASEVLTGTGDIPYSGPRTCAPQVLFTRVSGAGTLAIRFVGFWLERTDEISRGPQNLQPAAAADLQVALASAERLMSEAPCILGWFGDYRFPTAATTAVRWYALGDKNDLDTTTTSIMDARSIIYQQQVNATFRFTVEHSQNLGAAAVSRNLPDSAVNTYTPLDLPVSANSYKTATAWSGGKLDVSAGADKVGPCLRAIGIHRRMTIPTVLALVPAITPSVGRQVRTAEAAGAVGINTIAAYIHKCSWYAGGNYSGGMAETAGKAFTVSAKTAIFDGLIWVHDDAQSGSTWGTNQYQVALRATNASTAVTMTCTLTVDGQSGTADLTFANGENYLTFDINLTSIDVTKYAVACLVELANSASRTTTVYSVQISRRGAAY